MDAIIRHASSWKAERASTRVSRATLTRNSPSTHPARACGQVRVRVRVSRMQILLLFIRLDMSDTESNTALAFLARRVVESPASKSASPTSPAFRFIHALGEFSSPISSE